jgi:hypothetical protein
LSIGLLSRICTNASSQRLVNENAQGVSDGIMKLLEGWYPAEQAENIHASLASLVKNSIDLSQLLRRQRAYWFVTYENETNADQLGKFDTEIMTDIDTDDIEEDRWAAEGGKPNRPSAQPKKVRFKIFPGLFKRGNADGLHYDIKECYVKIRVKVL